MLWAMGNYSRFIRPGAVRIDAGITEEKPSKNQLLVSAYKNGKTLTVVIINDNAENVPVNLNISGGKTRNLKAFTTSAAADLKASTIADQRQVIIEAKSVTTITSTIQ